MELRVAVEEDVERLEPAEGVLREVGAVDAHHQVLAAARSIGPSSSATSGEWASSSNIGALTEIG